MSTAKNRRGSALIMVLVMIVILTSLSAFMLSTATSKNTAVKNTTDKAASMNLAEAGLDRAIAALDASNADGTGVYSNIACGTGTYSTTVVDLHNAVDATGALRVDNPAAKSLYRITATGRHTRDTKYPAVSTVEAIVQRKPTSFFTKAMFADVSLVLSGTVMSDSYDSALGTYAAQAVNNNGKMNYGRKNGDVGCNGDITDKGTVDIFGKATPGPGCTVNMTGTVSISGSTDPAASKQVLAPVVYAPPSGLAATAVPYNSAVGMATGNYRWASVKMATADKITIAGNVTIYLDGNWDCGAKSLVEILPGGSLTIYQAPGKTLDLTGQGVLNSSQVPGNFQIFSAGSSVKITGGSGFYGVVYAPSAVVNLGGNSEYYGAVVASQISPSGTFAFHYDEALGRRNDTGLGALTMLSWRQTQ